MTAPLPPIFVISLARSAARRRRMQEQFARLGLEPEFIDAVDGASLSGDDPALSSASVVQPHLGRPLTRGEVGCLLSHGGVHERVVRERIPLACVLEDDCLVSHVFPRVLRAVARGDGPWDVLLFGHHSRRHDPGAGAETCYRSVAAGDGFRVARVAEFPMGAYAYAVTCAGATTLLRHARPLRMPADWVVGYSPAAGARLYAVTPPCVQPDPALAPETTMPGRDVSPPPAPGSPHVLRDWAGRVLLLARKAGVRPAAYVKRI